MIMIFYILNVKLEMKLGTIEKLRETEEIIFSLRDRIGHTIKEFIIPSRVTSYFSKEEIGEAILGLLKKHQEEQSLQLKETSANTQPA